MSKISQWQERLNTVCNSEELVADSKTAFFAAQSNWTPCIHSLLLTEVKRWVDRPQCLKNFTAKLVWSRWVMYRSWLVPAKDGRSGQVGCSRKSRSGQLGAGFTKLKLHNCYLEPADTKCPNSIKALPLCQISFISHHSPSNQFNQNDQFCDFNFGTKMLWLLSSAHNFFQSFADTRVYAAFGRWTLAAPITLFSHEVVFPFERREISAAFSLLSKKVPQTHTEFWTNF